MSATLRLVAALAVCLATDALARPGAGDVPPAGLGIDKNGDDASVAQSAGKVTVVTFWASWCGPCRKEIPMLEGLQRAAAGRVQVVAVNIEDREQYRRVVRTLGPLEIRITHDFTKQAREAYGVNGIPHMVIIGRDGRIAAVHRGYSEAAVDGLLAEINAALAAQ